MTMPWEDRFWAKVHKTDGCWEWTAARSNGYGSFYLPRDGRRPLQPAHRVAYELLVGPIPKGLEIDHLCRNKACVNPAHLEPVTHRENDLRGVGMSAINAAKTHCHKGHPLAGDNLCFRVSGRHTARVCRTCHNEWHRQRNAKEGRKPRGPYQGAALRRARQRMDIRQPAPRDSDVPDFV